MSFSYHREQPSAIVTEALTLAATDAEVFDAAFLGRTGACPWPKAYGGDMVAQAVVAASLTVTDGKSIHSMHSYFMRPVDIGAEVRYEVEVLRDGRGYSTRQVRAFQHGKPVFVCLASFALGEDGTSFQAEMPRDLPHPTELPSSADYLAGRSGGTMTTDAQQYWSHGRGFDMRHLPGPIYLTVEGNSAPHQAVWVKPFRPLAEVPHPVSPHTAISAVVRNQAALAWVCDYTILEPALRVSNLSWAEPGLVTASLDHSLWFHREVPINEWLLYAQEAISIESGRGLCTGRFFTTAGTLVATVAQEGMVRAHPKENRP